jgi:hypothetical protein
MPTKTVEPYAPACCLCARSNRNRKGQRCAHADPHRYCADHQAQIDAFDHQPLCHAHATGTRLPDDALATCAQWAVKGSLVCRRHGAGTQASRAKQARNIAKANAYAQAEVIRQQRGFGTELDPLQVLRRCLDEAMNWADLWHTEVHRISNGHEAQLIGWNHLGDQAIDIAYQCYTDALDRAAKFAKLCLDAGVAERLTKVHEDTLALLGSVLLKITADLGVDESIARPVIARHLRALPA